MRQMIGTLITQACEMAVFVYQCYCVEKKSIEEISNELSADAQFIRLIAQYYDKKTDSK